MNNINLIKETLGTYESDLLYDMDILVLLLGEKVVKSLEENNINTIAELKNCTDEELLNMNFIGKETLLKIKAIIELTKRNYNKNSNVRISQPSDVYRLCEDMKYYEREVLRLICLDAKNKVIKNIDIFKGGLNASVVDVRVLMKEVIKNNSNSFIIAHNHPSGVPTPSQEDKDITFRIKKAGEIIGAKLLDHLIIGNSGRYVSFEKMGIL